MANQQQQQLVNDGGGGEKEVNPHESEGHIELKIENLSGFVQQPINSKRVSAPVHVRGVPWKISAWLQESGEDGQQKQKCLGYYVHCNGGADPSWSFFATAKLKLMAQRTGGVDHVLETNCFYYVGKESLGFSQFMTFEEIMNLNEGWYDAQADCITLAVDLTGVGEYVVVAQNELTLDQVPTRFSVQIGNLGWYAYKIGLIIPEINFNADNKKNQNNKLVRISCKDVAKGKADKVLLELFGYHRDDQQNESYSPISTAAVRRHLFTAEHNSLTVNIPSRCENLLFTVRVWKERGQFPDFTKPTAMVGRFSANVRLRVGDQQFHVNRQLLSTLSPFFDRMFNSDYPSATQDELELSLDTHSAELFHHFLLSLCLHDVLPNSLNVDALYKVADFYDAENVNKKCDQHLRMAREMPIEKRVLLARDNGSSETQDLIVDSANLEQAKRISRLFMKNRSI